MKLAVIGGSQQGAEACYLAQKAGIPTLLVDREENAPARGLCDEFIQADIRYADDELVGKLRTVDFILPALEDEEALWALERMKELHWLKLAFDFRAHAITSSPKMSRDLLIENGIPTPLPFPQGNPPYVLCPRESGEGPRRFETAEELNAFLSGQYEAEEYVAHELLTGPCFSIQVIGRPGDYHVYAPTQITADEHRCYRLATAPRPLNPAEEKELAAIALRVAELVELAGILDVKTVLHQGTHRVVEFSARLPVHAPTAVYLATGVNYIQELAVLFAGARYAGHV